MFKIHHFFFICILVLLVSCARNGNQMRQETNIEVADSIELELGLPYRMVTSKGLLFLSDAMGHEQLVQVYDINSRQYLFSFADKGSGPNEFILIDNMSLADDRIILFDTGSRKMGSFTFEDLIKDKDGVKPYAIESFASDSLRIFNINKIDNGFVATGMFEEGKFALLTDSFKVIGYEGEYRNKLNATVDISKHIMANHGAQFLSNNKCYMADIIYGASILSLYELNNMAISKVWEYVGDELDYTVRGNGVIVNNKNVGYISAFINGDYVYALYSGETENDDEIAPYGQSIHIFDINTGNMLESCNLNRRCFAIDTDGQRLFVLSHLPEPVVLIYELPKL